jgi:hypothetical protein
MNFKERHAKLRMSLKADTRLDNFQPPFTPFPLSLVVYSIDARSHQLTLFPLVGTLKLEIFISAFLSLLYHPSIYLLTFTFIPYTFIITTSLSYCHTHTLLYTICSLINPT